MVITPPVGTESTLIVRTSSVSSSVGADISKGMLVLSSSIVTVESTAAIGSRFDDPLHAEIVIEASDGKSIDLTPGFRLFCLLIRRCFNCSSWCVVRFKEFPQMMIYMIKVFFINCFLTSLNYIL